MHDSNTQASSMLELFSEDPIGAIMFLLQAGIRATNPRPMYAHNQWVRAICNFGDLPMVTAGETKQLTTEVIKTEFPNPVTFGKVAVTVLSLNPGSKAVVPLFEALIDELLPMLEDVVFEDDDVEDVTEADETNLWLDLARDTFTVTKGHDKAGELLMALGRLASTILVKKYISKLSASPLKAGIAQALYKGINSKSDPETVNGNLAAQQALLARLGVKERDDGQPLTTAEIIVQLSDVYTRAIQHDSIEPDHMANIKLLGHVLAGYIDEEGVEKLYKATAPTYMLGS